MDLNISLTSENPPKRGLLNGIIVFGFIATIVSLFGPNPFLCVPAFFSLYFIVDSLFLSRYLSGFLLAFIYQWVQVSVKVIYGCFTMTDIANLTSFPNHIINCYILSSLGLIVITKAISIHLRRIDFDEDNINLYFASIDVKKLLISYFAIGIVASILPFSLYQIAVQLSAFKWGIFYLLFLKSRDLPKAKLLIVSLILFEFILGLISYFSSWKYIIFYTAISFLSVIKLTPRRLLILSLCSVGLIYLGLMWTGIKGEYRTFIGQGQKQVVLVSGEEALTKIFELGQNFKLTEETTKSFIDRISYIDYFSACMNHVPSIVGHEKGALTANAIKHSLVPRILNRNKEVIDESAHLTKYTGVFFSNLSMGVSFSLGYFGDFYVDFGLFGMLIAIFIMGYIIGWGFRNIYTHIKNPLLGIATLQMSFMLLYKFEISLIKLTGTLVVFWILYYILAKWGFPQLSKWLFDEK